MISEPELLDRFENVQRQRDGDWLVRCRAHNDGRPSLHVTRTDDRWLLHCLAGCPKADVLTSAGLTPHDLNGNANGRGIIAHYEYTDERGALLFEVVRFQPKDFRQRRPDGRGGWIWKLDRTRRVLYRLPKIIETANAGDTIYICEGEEDVHALEAAGKTATCNPGGAGKWRREYSAALKGANVIIVADDDKPGHDHAANVAKSLDGAAKNVTIVKAAEGNDARDHLTAGRTVDELVPIKDQAHSKPRSEAPPPPEIDGAELLTDIRAFTARYIVLPSDEAADLLALYVIHTWTLDAATYTPYLHVRSPVKRAGKTRLLEVLELVCRNAMTAGSVTAAAVFQTIESQRPTLLIDEIDRVFQTKGSEHAEALIGVLNDGFRSKGRVIRGSQSGEPKTFSTWCPKVLAGIENSTLPDTIADRCIVISLERKLKGDRVDRLRGRDVDGEAAGLRERCAAWAHHHIDTLAEYRLDTIEAISDRAEDIWEPLLAIADEAGGTWAKRARKAVLALASEESGEQSDATTLLADIRDAFGRDATISTEALLKALNANDERPWGARRNGLGLDGRGLAKMLKPFKTPDGVPIKPRTIGSGHDSAKGYRADQFRDAFPRYLSVSVASVASVAPKPQSQANATDATDATDTQSAGTTLKEPTCTRREHRATDWRMPNARQWICGTCHPPTGTLANTAIRRGEQ